MSKIENQVAYEMAFDRATITTREQDFRGLLKDNREGRATDREAYLRACELLGVEPALNKPWWIYVERERLPDLALGPFPDEEMAVHSMNESLLMDGITEEDCTDSWVTNDQPDGSRPTPEQVIIDLDDPDHTGVSK